MQKIFLVCYSSVAYKMIQETTKKIQETTYISAQLDNGNKKDKPENNGIVNLQGMGKKRGRKK